MRWIKIKYLSLCTAILILGNFLYAQTKDGMAKQDFLPASPDVAALGKFGDVPVNLSTGVPNISIPFYELKEGNISLPIGINYNASGIKVQEEASQVGLGWSLNAGGAVTRIIRGITDESPNGFFNRYDTIKKLINNEYSGAAVQKKYSAILKGELDGEPDLFICNIGGLTFKFSMNINGKFETIPVSNYKIAYSQSNKNDNATGVWSITDDQGNSYSFGGKINAPIPFYLVERARRLEATDNNDPKAWFINYIKPSSFTAVNNSLIRFEYLYNSLQRSPVFYNESAYKPVNENSLLFGLPESKSVAVRSDIQTVVLQKIIWSQGEVSFQTSKDREDNLTLYKLNSVSVYSRGLQLIQTCQLNYDYFNKNEPGNTKRLQLTSVIMGPQNVLHEVTGELINPPKYSFEYNDVVLPAVTSMEQDHWGYYNGPNNNTTLIPSVKVFVPAPSGQPQEVTYTSTGKREVNPIYATMGIIKKMTYPTGGVTEFEFEANTQSNVDMNRKLINQPKDAFGNFYFGGVRIKRVKIYDPYHPEKNSIKKYNYNEIDGKTSGRINEFPIYAFFQGRAINYSYSCVGYDPADCSRFQYYDETGYVVIRQNSQFNLSNIAQRICYTKVEVLNGENAELGKEEYTFSYAPALAADEQINLPFAEVWDLGWKTNLFSEKHSKKEGVIFKPIIENVFDYASINSSSAIKGVKVGLPKLLQQFIDYPDSKPHFYAEIDIEQTFKAFIEVFNTDYTFQSSQSVKTYSSDNTSSITSASQTEIDPISLQPKSVKTINSEGQTEEIRRKFAANYNIPQVTGTDPYPLQGIANLQAKNIPGAIVEETKLLNGNITGSALNIYDIAIPKMVKNYATESVAPIPEREFVFSNIQGRNVQFDTRYKELIEFTQYDNAGNPLLQKYKDGHAVAALWDYNNSLPVAEIKLGNPDKDVYIKQNTDPRTNIYKYNFAYTSFEGTNNGNWLGVSASGITETTTPMGKYAYDIAKGSLSYSYDPLSRGQLSDYYLYYWKHPQATVNVTSNAGSQVKEILFTNKDGWQLVRHTLKQGYSVAVKGTGFIDEIRLFTTDSRISTVAYIPGLGIQCQADNNGRLQYYFYDEFTRLVYTKDMEGNILKTFDYQFQK